MLALGPQAVVVTGGHSEELVDLFFDGERRSRSPASAIPDGAAHGSGCTHSSALAAFLARGLEPLEAARRARARSPPKRSATACARSVEGPARWTSSI